MRLFAKAPVQPLMALLLAIQLVLTMSGYVLVEAAEYVPSMVRRYVNSTLQGVGLTGLETEASLLLGSKKKGSQRKQSATVKSLEHVAQAVHITGDEFQRPSQSKSKEQAKAKGQSRKALQAPPPITADELRALSEIEKEVFLAPLWRLAQLREQLEIGPGLIIERGPRLDSRPRSDSKPRSDSSLRNDSKPRSKAAPRFEDANNLDGAVVRDLACLIGYSMGFGESGPRSGCDHVHVLAEGCFYGIRTKRHVLIAFPPDLSHGLRSETRARLDVHERFEQLRQPLNAYLEQLLEAQCGFVFTGIGDGGALAVMAAWHAIIMAEQLKTKRLSITSVHSPRELNEDNQIKVVTFDELIPFTRDTAHKSPIQERNHLRLGSSADSLARQILPLGSLNDADVPIGKSVHTNMFPTPPYVAFSEPLYTKLLESFNAEIGLHAGRLDFSGFYRACNVPAEDSRGSTLNLPSETEDMRPSTLASRAFQLVNAYQYVFPETYRALQVEEHLSRPRAACHKLGQLLERDFFGEPVACEVFDYSPEKQFFRISCNLGLTTAHSRNVLSFFARLGNEEAWLRKEACSVFEEVSSAAARGNAYKTFRSVSLPGDKQSKSRHRSDEDESETDDEGEPDVRHCGAMPNISPWSRCIHSLATLAAYNQPKKGSSLGQAPNAMQTLLPLLFVDEEHRIQSGCTFLSLSQDEPLKGIPSKGRANKPRRKLHDGVYLRACNASEDMRRLYWHHRDLFYRIFQAAADSGAGSFPLVCKDQLLPIPLRDAEAKLLLSLSGPAAQYLSGLMWPGPLASPVVELWNPPLPRPFAAPTSASSFDTIEMFRSTTVALSVLSKRSIYKPDFEWELKRCVEDDSWLVYDCTDPANLWIPGACPEFCIAAHREAGLIDERFCKNIRKCGAAGFFVSISPSERSGWLSSYNLGSKASNTGNQSKAAVSPLQKLALRLNAIPRCIFGCFRVKIMSAVSGLSAIASMFSSETLEFDLALVSIQPQNEPDHEC
jgi:hypothetical protein